MALSVSMLAVAQGYTRATIPSRFTVTVTNTDASSRTLLSLLVYESSGDAVVQQPQILTPNVPQGVGNPIIAASGSATYSFQAVFPAPYSPGPSPANPGGRAPSSLAVPADAIYRLVAVANTSDGSVFSSSLQVPVLSTAAPIPTSQGGTLRFRQGGNMMSLALMGAL